MSILAIRSNRPQETVQESSKTKLHHHFWNSVDGWEDTFYYVAKCVT